MAVRFDDITSNLLKRRKYAEYFFIIFYIIGFLGIVAPFSHQVFIGLFPVALVLSFAAILFFHDGSFDAKIITILILTGLLSYLIEVAGVNTHLIFGNYKYGEALGIKVFDTPILIALNWVMLVYAGSSISEGFLIPSSLKIILASFIVLIYDIILEQIAPVVGMWYWENNIVPARNYVAWFIIALVFQTLIRISGVKIRNSIAWKIILIQALFFLFLLLVFKLLR